METQSRSTTSEHQNALLQVVAGPSAGTLIRVDRELRIGRAEHGAGALGSDPELSRHHATIQQSRDGVLTIEDAGSSNGTYVNDTRITQPRGLYPGDMIRLGATTLLVGPPPHPMGDDHPTTISQQRPGGASGASLAQAKKLFNDGDLVASLAMYRRVIAAHTDLGPAYQGAGYICFLRKDFGEAEQLLAASLQANPSNPNAWYLRGQVAAATGDTEAERTAYSQALAIDPNHARAQDALRRIDRERQVKPPAPAQDTASRSDATPREALARGDLGVYEYLRQDNSVLSNKAVSLIDKLQVSRYPRLTAFFGRRSHQKLHKGVKLLIVLIILFWVAAAATHISSVAAHDGPDIYPVSVSKTILVSAILIGVPFLVYLIREATTKYTIARGRLTLDKMLFTRDTRTTELWRVKLIETHQSIPNRLTGDGTLIFTLNDDKTKILVTGLASYSELEKMRVQMMDLIFALRANPMIKGIVQ